MYKAPRGTQDILPEDQSYWRYVCQRIHHVCQLYDYRQIDTPIFEGTSLYVRGVGETTDIVEKEMYSFEDKGGQPITLRPEFTAGVVRAYLEHGMRTLPQPVKLYSMGPIFRYERPQAGRYRQHTQFNVEAIGESDPAVDVEVMSVAWQLFQDLGFKDLSFQVNSTGCPRCRPDYLKRLLGYYEGHTGEICWDCQRRLGRNPLRLLDCKVDQCQPVIISAPRIREHLCDECQKHFETLLGYLDMLGWPYEISHRLVRGIDYYTKTVFEVFAAGIGAQNAVCGGGRYDGLMEQLGGPSTPGIGFGSGIERIILTMKHAGVEVPVVPSPRVMVIHAGQDAKRVALKLAADLRFADIGALVSFGDRSLKAQFRQANNAEISYALILGQDELTTEQVTLRDMGSGEQIRIDLAKIVPELQRRLGQVD